MPRVHYLIPQLVLVGAFMIAGCGGSRYGDLEKVLETEIDVMSNFVSDMEKASDAKAVASAIRTYTDGMKQIIPQLTKIKEKYPKLKTQPDLPEKLKTKMDRVEELAQQMQGAIMKSSRYMMDPEVQKAWEDFGKIMKELHGQAS